MCLMFLLLRHYGVRLAFDMMNAESNPLRIHSHYYPWLVLPAFDKCTIFSFRAFLIALALTIFCK